MGTSQSLSGPLVFPGQEEIAGMEAYMEMVNAQGGVHGRKLKVLFEDDGFSPTKALAGVKKLTIGAGDRSLVGHGKLFIDDIRVTKP